MSDNRKSIIIKEIQYWKKNKLLPEKYCDFLLVLYTQGNQETNELTPNKPIKELVLLFGSVLLFIVSTLVIYFTEMQMLLQISLLFIFGIISYLIYRFLKGKRNVNTIISLIIFLLILFLLSVQIIKSLELPYWLTLFTVIFHCAVWVIVGILKRIYFLTISGVIGVLFVAIIILA